MTNPAVEALKYARKTECPKEFIDCWLHADFDVIRAKWPDAPQSIFPSPESDPIAETDFIDELAQEIRRVDGNHSLGAAALAERLVPFFAAKLKTIA